jgi:hypothetical protein
MKRIAFLLIPVVLYVCSSSQAGEADGAEVARLSHVEPSAPVGASLQLVPNSLDYLSKDLRENINKSLHHGKFETVLQGNNLLSFNELKQQFNYLSVVCLKNGCLPC